MVAAGLAGLVMGCLFGLRFRVLILLPVEIAALAAGLLAASSGAASGLSAFAAFTLFSAGLQVSYMVALSLPFAVRRPAARHPAKA